jgi:hypothetical protein
MRSPILKQASIATGCIPQVSTCGNQNNEDGTFDETEDWWCKYYKHQTGVGKSKLSSKGELKIDLLTQEFSDREPSGTSCSPKPEMARFPQGAARKSKR